MSLELRATERIGKLESTETLTDTLFVLSLFKEFAGSNKTIKCIRENYHLPVITYHIMPIQTHFYVYMYISNFWGRYSKVD